jgi:glutamyl-tRNA(Gln) amidotransferase subunit E
VAYEASGLNEEPPHELNQDALETALTVALMVGATPINETHVMRKVVIDGSTPFGFQRTAVVALNGGIEVGGKRIPIQTICVEEDASRRIKDEGMTVYYRLDRLGIPLIEVVTGPVINSPEEAEEVALAIGQILRATGKVRRGLGTIRQDVNISIPDGALVEVKGVQELELLPKVVEYEVQRQLALLKISRELERRKVKEEELKGDFKDVTEVFEGTKCRVIRNAIEKGCIVKAVVLPKFSGLLGTELIPGLRFGTELSDYAKFWGKVGGIFHTDELPAYGIMEDEVNELKSLLGIGESDAVVFVADKPENVYDALSAVVKRAKQALIGVPSETRGSHSDGTTHYLRPRPGAGRMYPETDVPPVPITADLLKRIEGRLPEPPEIQLSRLMEDHGLNRKLATQVLNSDYREVFEALASMTRVAPSFIAATLTETFKSMRREGVDVSLLTEGLIKDVFILVDSGIVAKEAIQEILTWMARHDGAELEDAVEELDLRMISEGESEAIVERIIKDNEALIEELKADALGPLMGIIMKKLRGKADAKWVSQLIKRRIKEMSKG